MEIDGAEPEPFGDDAPSALARRRIMTSGEGGLLRLGVVDCDARTVEWWCHGVYFSEDTPIEIELREHDPPLWTAGALRRQCVLVPCDSVR